MNATCNNHGNRIAIENYKQPLGCYCVEPDIAYSQYVPESSLEYNKWRWLSSAPIYRGSGDSYARGDTANDPSSEFKERNVRKALHDHRLRKTRGTPDAWPKTTQLPLSRTSHSPLSARERLTGSRITVESEASAVSHLTAG